MNKEEMTICLEVSSLRNDHLNVCKISNIHPRKFQKSRTLLLEDNLIAEHAVDTPKLYWTLSILWFFFLKSGAKFVRSTSFRSCLITMTDSLHTAFALLTRKKLAMRMKTTREKRKLTGYWRKKPWAIWWHCRPKHRRDDNVKITLKEVVKKFYNEFVWLKICTNIWLFTRQCPCWSSKISEYYWLNQQLIKGKVCQTQLFISELQRHVSAYSEAIIRLQI